MKAEQQYIDLFTQCEAMICRHSADVLNAPYGCRKVLCTGLRIEP